MTEFVAEAEEQEEEYEDGCECIVSRSQTLTPTSRRLRRRGDARLAKPLGIRVAA